ncbi:TPA: phage head closure protein [Clostridium botulinum]|uniref:phage head closure protein n=1 Tax=Clostridium botulinum TaxID=1491 RepID=UPI0007731E2F|nr:phage head closure protein [Clostridium botulinum]AUN16120.1 head-tail adaptor protein [Clostridium botulinum]AUN16141.1 head-tail adaptor protein [Clostridium botulinum]MBN3375831.1 head-tail adaptor protein [Clostridium botulinum]MBN3399558.1 head-tail adaptor protein [Clostridium botulinum]MBN3414481.1 head-tail adaptor protein [Clostridium botulinum]
MATNRIKDKKITILKYQEGENELGETIVTYVPMPGATNIWAYYRHASGAEFYAAHTINTKVEVIFEIAWRNDIDTYMQIRYKGRDYSITRIDDFEGRKVNLRIYAYKVN